jgi:hypothetical protein
MSREAHALHRAMLKPISSVRPSYQLAAITGPLKLPQFNAKAREDLIECYIDGRKDNIPPAELQIVFDQQWDIDRTRAPIELLSVKVADAPARPVVLHVIVMPVVPIHFTSV